MSFSLSQVGLVRDRIRHVLNNPEEFVSLHEPRFEGKEQEYVQACVRSTFVSSVGEFVGRFEDKLAEYAGVKRAVAVVNGTAALQVACQLAGVQRDDEVLMPSLTFVATANAVSYLGAIPHFVDSEVRSLGVDAVRLSEYLGQIGELTERGFVNKATGRRIRAIVPMHVFGHPVDMDTLCEVCRKFGIVLVEDAAESLGSYYKGRHTGGFGRVAAMSFNGNKLVTCGGGGAILTDDEELGSRAKHLTTTARVQHRWSFIHDEIGYNFRMPNLNAALGLGQLESLEPKLERKRKLAASYQEALGEIEGFSVFMEPSYAKSNYWLNALLLDKPDYSDRDALLRELNDNGLMARPVWQLMSSLPMYSRCPSMDLPVAKALEARIVNIPSSPHLIR